MIQDYSLSRPQVEQVFRCLHAYDMKNHNARTSGERPTTAERRTLRCESAACLWGGSLQRREQLVVIRM